MAHWIKNEEIKNGYSCSACGGTIVTGTPIEWWTRCPFCHETMTFESTKEEATDGNIDTAENS